MKTGRLIWRNHGRGYGPQPSPNSDKWYPRQRQWSWGGAIAIALCCSGGWVSGAIAQVTPDAETS
ncbi:MAG: hypothetical protein VKJ64_00705, partial [Leptolyngbyaceae bacterium]|nr:hypothetical protein [Leptolyngbyaceae bacterium]